MIDTIELRNRLLILSKHSFDKEAPFYLRIKLTPLRDLAKSLADEPIDWSRMRYDVHYELNLIQGIIVGYSKMPLEEKWRFYQTYFQHAQDWSYVDSSMVSLPKRIDLVSVNKAAREYLCSSHPYVRRFGYVLALRYLINTPYLATFLELIDPNEQVYHVYMAIAWFLAECFIKDRMVFEDYMSKSDLSLWTRQKTVSKIRDSFRVSVQDKEYAKRFKELEQL
ncbi:MAG TPA: DNA alkylation repair protein [Bacilli bacterium]|nr:DNA alkylation repair protein [Bacilli bacterium]